MDYCRGIDISSNQARQDWQAHLRKGVKFAFIKASEGERTRDGRFSVHMTDAKAAKITVVGAYHYAWPNESVALNVTNYVDAVRPFAGKGFVHWLDLEAYGDGRNYHGVTDQQILLWVSAWLTGVEKAFPGQRVGIYAGGNQVHRVPAGWPRWFPMYPVGLTTYELAEGHVWPGATGVADVDFWQFCGSPLDRSIFRGSEADLERWANGSSGTSAPAKPKPKPTPRVWTVRAGQTLGGIAVALGATVAALASYNHIHNVNVIHPGQRITAPPAVAAKPPAKPPAKPKPKPPAKATRHVVRKNETLSGIAAAAGIRDWHTLASYNHLTHPDRLTVGQVILIPGKN